MEAQSRPEKTDHRRGMPDCPAVGSFHSEYVSFRVDKYGWLDAETTAKTTTFKGARGHDRSTGFRCFTSVTDKIPFLIRKDMMESDEAIVAVIGHEMYELEEIRKAFAETVLRSNTGWPKLTRTTKAISTGLRGTMQMSWWRK